jgi:hypothetical protein
MKEIIIAANQLSSSLSTLFLSLYSTKTFCQFILSPFFKLFFPVAFCNYIGKKIECGRKKEKEKERESKKWARNRCYVLGERKKERKKEGKEERKKEIEGETEESCRKLESFVCHC